MVEKSSGRVWVREIFREDEANAEGLTSVAGSGKSGRLNLPAGSSEAAFLRRDIGPGVGVVDDSQLH
jgi:hypothetical protein